MILWALACVRLPPVPDDLAAACGADWATANCAGGVCAQERSQVWADGYLQHLSDTLGRTLDELRGPIEVRSSYIDASGGSADLTVHLQVGWVAAIYPISGFLGHPPADAADAATAFHDAPQVPLAAVPRDWEDVQRVLASCERDNDVALPESGWCDSHVALDTRDAELLGLVSYTFGPADSADGEPVFAKVFPFGDQPDLCEVMHFTVVP